MHRAHAVAAVLAPRRAGRSECADCGEPITALRQSMGAQLCIDCQTEAEARGRGVRRG